MAGSHLLYSTTVRYNLSWAAQHIVIAAGVFYVNDRLKGLIYEELQQSYSRNGVGGFLPAVKQVANVAALPGIVEVLLALFHLPPPSLPAQRFPTLPMPMLHI